MRIPLPTHQSALRLCLTFIVVGAQFSSLAQDDSSLPTLDSLRPIFLSGLSPVILPKDRVEINNYNPLTSFWIAAQETPPELAGAQITNRYRYTLFENYVRVSYGFSYNRRWDLGAEFRFTQRRLDDDARTSPLKVFGADSPNSKTYRGLSMVGARARYMPFRRLPELTLQGALTFPVAKEEMQNALSLNRTQFDLAATFYRSLNKNTYYFLQSDWVMRFAKAPTDHTTHQWSTSAFLIESFFHHKIYVYPGITYSGLFQKFSNQGFKQANYQILGGLGVQYQPVRVFIVSLYAQIPFTLESGSATAEWVRESYTSVTLGFMLRF